MELAGLAAQRRVPKLERQLDDAIFDLYELNVAERDLVREMCSVGLDLFYCHQKSDAVREVVEPQCRSRVLTDLGQHEDGLALYLRAFLEVWNIELGPDGEFGWRIYSPPSKAPLLAVCFTTRYKKDPLPKSSGNEAEAWHKLLAKLARNSLTRADASRIYIDTFFRHVTDREILFIKRNVTGGSTGYTYSWTGPNSYTSTTQNPGGLAAGTYNITVTDANGCIDRKSIILTAPAPLTTSSISAHQYNDGYNVTCNVSSNGSITYNATGGSTSYTYNWTGPNSYTSTSQNPGGLPAGSYNLTVTDANGCTTTNAIILTAPAPLSTSGIRSERAHV